MYGQHRGFMDWTERLNKGVGTLNVGRGKVEVLYWHRQAHLPDNRPHTHTFFEVCQVGRWGAGRFTAGGSERPIRSGDVFIARPGVVHQIVNTALPLMELRWVCFQWIPDGTGDDTDSDRLMREFVGSKITVSPDTDRRVGAIWDALSSVAEASPRLGFDSQAEGLVHALILALAQSGTSPDGTALDEPDGPEPGYLTAGIAVRYVHDNLARPLTLPEIASHVAVSTRHLARVFHRYVGTSPATYVLRARLDRSSGMLTHSSDPIKEIAKQVGFDDVHHFTRVFTHHYGCPPGEYRRTGQGPYVPNIQKPGILI